MWHCAPNLMSRHPLCVVNEYSMNDTILYFEDLKKIEKNYTLFWKIEKIEKLRIWMYSKNSYHLLSNEMWNKYPVAAFSYHFEIQTILNMNNLRRYQWESKQYLLLSSLSIPGNKAFKRCNYVFIYIRSMLINMQI